MVGTARCSSSHRSPARWRVEPSADSGFRDGTIVAVGQYRNRRESVSIRRIPGARRARFAVETSISIRFSYQTACASTGFSPAGQPVPARPVPPRRPYRSSRLRRQAVTAAQASTATISIPRWNRALPAASVGNRAVTVASPASVAGPMSRRYSITRGGSRSMPGARSGSARRGIGDEPHQERQTDECHAHAEVRGLRRVDCSPARHRHRDERSAHAARPRSRGTAARAAPPAARCATAAAAAISSRRPVMRAVAGPAMAAGKTTSRPSRRVSGSTSPPGEAQRRAADPGNHHDGGRKPVARRRRSGPACGSGAAPARRSRR